MNEYQKSFSVARELVAAAYPAGLSLPERSGLFAGLSVLVSGIEKQLDASQTPGRNDVLEKLFELRQSVGALTGFMWDRNFSRDEHQHRAETAIQAAESAMAQAFHIYDVSGQDN